MLGIGLREHHQLDVGRVAPDADEVLHQVIEFVVRQRQPQALVGCLQRGTSAVQHIDTGQFARRHVAEQLLDVGQRHYGFGHAVMQQRQQARFRLGRQRLAGSIQHMKSHPALDAAETGQAAVLQDIGGLR
jgi:hypothetical protein